MKNIVSILGSGFGLYGYLPAMIDIGVKKILLPSRYQVKLSHRPELSTYLNNILWVQDENEAIRNADTIVIALTPDLQGQWVSNCLKLPNIERLILEKPMARTPDIAKSLLKNIVSSGKILRIGYIFRYTSWGKELIQFVASRPDFGGSGRLRISWIFLANHFKDNTSSWKRYNIAGGGAIRFYGIQLIALLAKLGYTKVLSSKSFGTVPDEVFQWLATFSGQSLPDCEVLINTIGEVNRFTIERVEGSRIISNVSQVDPFGDMTSSLSYSDLDVRVTPLSQFCRTLWDESESNNEWYNATVNLWYKVENCVLFQKVSI